MLTSIPIIVLGVIFLLIAFRQFFFVQFGLWQIFILAAMLLILLGQITPLQALNALNYDVLAFLLGLFIIGKALEQSGLLEHALARLWPTIKTVDRLILLILFGAGLLSAVFMNDTLAIIGVPLILIITNKRQALQVPLLLTLAFAVTIGSVLSPIGNPQNLIIATHGHLPNPLIDFLYYLTLPTLINFVIAFMVIKWFFKKELALGFGEVTLKSHIEHKPLAKLCLISSIAFFTLLIIKIMIDFIFHKHFLSFGLIAILASMPILLGSKQRIAIIKHIDWQTLLFFVGLFVVMQSVWQTGVIQQYAHQSSFNLTHIGSILTISTLLSQVISNVPLVSLYLPILTQHGATHLATIALAAGSTIAGNLTIIGAASNVIIIESYQKQTGKLISFWTFLKVGGPLTLLNVLGYYLYWHFLH